jgi:hypothetical protein
MKYNMMFISSRLKLLHLFTGQYCPLYTPELRTLVVIMMLKLKLMTDVRFSEANDFVIRIKWFGVIAVVHIFPLAVTPHVLCKFIFVVGVQPMRYAKSSVGIEWNMHASNAKCKEEACELGMGHGLQKPVSEPCRFTVPVTALLGWFRPGTVPVL